MDTITITFPEVKVKIPIKGLTFDILENMLFEILQDIARKVFEKAITDIRKTIYDIVSVNFIGVVRRKNIIY